VSPGNVWTPLWDEYATGEPEKARAISDGEKAQVMHYSGIIAITFIALINL
jgi:hypothetical protein